MIEKTVLFKQPPPKIGGMLPDAKVSLEEVNVAATLLFGDTIDKCLFSTWLKCLLASKRVRISAKFLSK